MQVLLRPSKFDISRMYEAIEKLKIVACDVGELNLAIEVDILEQILRLVEKVTTKYQMQSKIIYIFNYCPPWNNMKFKSVLEVRIFGATLFPLYNDPFSCAHRNSEIFVPYLNLSILPFPHTLPHK
jgi:hypothetical protein